MECSKGNLKYVFEQF